MVLERSLRHGAAATQLNYSVRSIPKTSSFNLIANSHRIAPKTTMMVLNTRSQSQSME
ncbi:hypothetical protein AB7M18_001247 [Pseudomonas viridiflava]